jgi:hypothetical protein
MSQTMTSPTGNVPAGNGDGKSGTSAAKSEGLTKRLVMQGIGSVLLGTALGLAGHFVAEPRSGDFFKYLGVIALAVGGGYLMFGPPRTKKIVFQFQGGFMDGKSLTGDLKSQAQGRGADEAVRHYFTTDRGTVGKRFWSASQYMIDTLRTHGGDVAAMRAASRDPRFQCDHYEVIEHREKDGEIVIRVKYISS